MYGVGACVGFESAGFTVNSKVLVSFVAALNPRNTVVESQQNKLGWLVSCNDRSDRCIDSRLDFGAVRSVRTAA